MNCPHCHQPINIGKLIRSVPSEARTAASRENGKKGGRPKTPEHRSHVYILRHPVTQVVVYVGQSVKPHSRLKSHIACYRAKNTPLNVWIKDLQSNGLTPSMEIVGNFPASETTEQEHRMIEHYRQQNPELFNIKKAVRASYSSKMGWAVECVETGDIYGGYAEAGRSHDCSDGTIRNRCNDGQVCYPSNLHFRRIDSEQAKAMVAKREENRKAKQNKK